MRLVYTLLAVAIATALAGATATVGSGEVAVHKQRIGIDEVFGAGAAQAGTDKPATFVVHPLSTPGDPHSPGRLVATDRGTVTVLVLRDGATTLRNGMRVGESAAREELIGRRGTLRLSMRFDVYDIPVNNGARALLGTWKIMGGTGAYSGLRGGGRYVGVVMFTGRRVARLEGWVTGG